MAAVEGVRVTRPLFERDHGQPFRAAFIDQQACWRAADAFRKQYWPSGTIPVDVVAIALTDDLTSEVAVLIQAYLDRYQIEFNHRDEKTVLGVGQAQVWSDKSTPRVPEFIVAAYSALLLAGLAA